MALRVKKVPEYKPLHGFPGNLFLPVSELKVPLGPLAVPTWLSIGPRPALGPSRMRPYSSVWRPSCSTMMRKRAR